MFDKGADDTTISDRGRKGRKKSGREAGTMMDASEHRANLVFTLLIAAEVLLIGVTWPLWTAIHPFPAAPLLSRLAIVPIAVDWLTLAVLLASTTTLLWNRRSWSRAEAVPSAPLVRQSKTQQRSLVLMTVAGSLLVVLNQHRLQPWHWLFLSVTAQSILLSGRHRLWALRLAFATIYVFAALSRLGPDVDTGMSRQLLRTACTLVGSEQLLRNETLFFNVCLAMTLVELAVGLCLMLPRFRRTAVVTAMILHALLLLLLSPIGLNHHSGVLIWNAFFLIAIPSLFADIRPQDAKSIPANVRLRITAAVIVLFPLSGLFGIADNWPSWQLYSARPDVVRLYVDQVSVGQLPKHIQPFVGQPAPLDRWCPVRVDRWSLATTGAPLYPEDRFQLAVVRAVLQNVPKAAVRITIESAESPAWWHRTTQELNSAELDEYTQTEFLLNGKLARQ
jgi:hypothetical protein